MYILFIVNYNTVKVLYNIFLTVGIKVYGSCCNCIKVYALELILTKVNHILWPFFRRKELHKQ